MKYYQLAAFDRPAPIHIVLAELDAVLEAVWVWEVSCHGRHEDRYRGRTVFEAVVELQEWLMEEN
jgi:hypothetical protein